MTNTQLLILIIIIALIVLVIQTKATHSQEKQKISADYKKEKEELLINFQKAKNELEKGRDNLIKEYDEEITGLQQKLTAKNNWGDQNIPQLKEELFNQALEACQELKEAISKSIIVWGWKEVEEKLETLEEFFENQAKK